jgi:hypothetical protein
MVDRKVRNGRGNENPYQRDGLAAPFDPVVSSLLTLSTELHPPQFGVLPTP